MHIKSTSQYLQKYSLFQPYQSSQTIRLPLCDECAPQSHTDCGRSHACLRKMSGGIVFMVAHLFSEYHFWVQSICRHFAPPLLQGLQQENHCRHHFK
ncbi:hypothetical protein Y032_0002g607 [Ancylostoma ceylanicum]|uniref:Uncharacterized protein n=1 Tax=Ancylostoma ceylanicum TaxID=53326 RepID=A0A016W0E9_9BILA|nr:hypothetical protein Y032_0002g607 [Ancylostoma ceylanicum]